MPKTKASLLVIAATAVTVATLFLLPFTPKTAVRTAAVERGDLIRSTPVSYTHLQLDRSISEKLTDIRMTRQQIDQSMSMR